MIRASGITLRRGTKVLLDDTSFVVNPGERLGIVGKNGAGKSTLFALLKGELDLDAGNLEMPASWPADGMYTSWKGVLRVILPLATLFWATPPAMQTRARPVNSCKRRST